MTSSLLRLAACLVITSIAHAESYQGAQALLDRLQQPAPPVEGAAPDAKNLSGQLEAFKREATKLEPAVAAKRWLALFESFASLPANQREEDGGTVDLAKLIEALPPATAWSALEKEIAATQNGRPPARHTALRVLMAALNGSPDVPALVTEIKAELKRGRGFLNRFNSYEERQVNELVTALHRRNGKQPDPVAAMKELIANTGANSTLEVPAGLARVPEAEALIIEALRKGVKLSVQDEAARKLAVKALLAQPELLKASQWSLIASVEDLPLAEAMLQRFPATESHDFSRRRAEQVLLAGKILSGKPEEALKEFLQSLQSASSDSDAYLPSMSFDDDSPFGVLQAKELQRTSLTQAEAIQTFYETSLRSLPVLPLWKSYIGQMAKDGRSKDAVAFMDSLAGQAAEGSYTRRLIDHHLPTALLAAGEVERGVAGLRARLAAGDQPAPAMNDAERTALTERLKGLGIEATPKLIQRLATLDSGDHSSSESLELALKLTELGRLLKRPEWVDEGVAVLIKSFDANDNHYATRQAVDALFKNGRGPAAEALMAAQLERLGKDEDNSYALASQAAELVGVYRRAGRYDDIIVVLDRFKQWDASDLADVTANAGDVPIQLAAAEAFFHQGKKDLALTLVKRVLDAQPGEDAAYRLRLELGGADLMADLDRVAQLNPFEERPLIWKAKHQLDAGRIDEAEKTIRAAIAIDPSDGEQGKGDRMRAYSILADVLEKKGDAETAKIFRGAVKAVRLSEDADDWWNAGLLTKAIAMYEEALTHFADAYCIQSRLALRYSEIGDLNNAEKHYQRAFELMPDSFGRVESHCFGCEGIFSGKTSQNVAERVFTKLAKEKPSQPQVHYLLGYLRENQGRHAEAATSFRHAVQLDPDYLNAWKKLQEIAEHVEMSAKEQDEIGFALFRLTREADALEDVTDLPRAWSAMLQTEGSLPSPLTGPLYPLAASAEATKAKQAPASRGFSSYGRSLRYYQTNPFGNHESYRAGFTENKIVSATKSLMERLLAHD